MRLLLGDDETEPLPETERDAALLEVLLGNGDVQGLAVAHALGVLVSDAVTVPVGLRDPLTVSDAETLVVDDSAKERDPEGERLAPELLEEVAHVVALSERLGDPEMLIVTLRD